MDDDRNEGDATDQASDEQTDETDTDQASDEQTDSPTGGSGGRDLETEIGEVRREAAKHRRERNDARKQVEALEAEKLTDQERLDRENKTLRDEIESVTGDRRRDRLAVAVATHAVDAGIRPVDAIAFIGDTVEFDDDAEPVGVAEAVATLAKDRPYLVQQTGRAAPRQGTDGGTGDDAKRRRFTRSELLDTKFYRKHETEILAAMHAGEIIDE